MTAPSSIFPFVVGVIEFGAALACAYQRQWMMALVWLCYTVASCALGFVK